MNSSRPSRISLVKFVEAQSIELRYSDKIGPAKGLSHGGKITLLSGMQPAEEFSTLVHEIGHELLHRGERRTLTTKTVRETEAEAVAFVVCQAIGLENGTSAACSRASGSRAGSPCPRPSWCSSTFGRQP